MTNELYYYGVTLNELSKGNLWYASDINIVEGCIHVSGWAVAHTFNMSEVTFMLNDHRCDDVIYPICRPEIANIYWYIPNSAMSGFYCMFGPEKTEDLKSQGNIALRLVTKDDHASVTGYLENAFRNPFMEQDDLPVPDLESLKRIGAHDLNHYKVIGYGKYKRLETALIQCTGKAFADMGRILDWGCGSGSVTRYLHKLTGSEIHGADIDGINIDWCKNNLPFINARLLALDPPSGYPDEYFDLIFGISVVTHLQETSQAQWLAELARITKTGGYVLLSIHGNAAVAFRNEFFDAVKLIDWQEKGFMALGVDNSIEAAIGTTDYYTTSFQTEKYVRDMWSKHFEVVDILPYQIGHFQDLVVLRKCAGQSHQATA